MTTAADDTSAEDAFEAFLAGRPVPDEAAPLAAFAGAVRATATLPGRPNAALAELLATGLLADQSSPSARTAGVAGTPPSRRARVRRRRFAMIFPALLAKLLSAGAVAQAATGAGVVLVVATGAGATGVLGDDVQDTFSTVVGASGEVTTEDDSAVTGDETTVTPTTPTTDPGAVQTPPVETTVPVEEEFDPEAWVASGPAHDETFGAWVSASAHNDQLREWLRSEGMTFGSMVRGWAHEKGLDDADLVEEGVDLDDLTEEPTTEPLTDETAGADDEADDTEVASTQGGNGNGRGNSGNAGGNSGSNGNGRGHK
jgi:hypothetical protein